MRVMNYLTRRSVSLGLAATVLAAAFGGPSPVRASSHMDAPSIVLDPAANTTDVYAFVTERNGVKFLSTALSVYPHQEPGIGPNKYNFDDSVRYEINLYLGDDLAAGRRSLTYRFEFTTRYKSRQTLLQAYKGVIQNVDDDAQNLTQTYTVTKVDHRARTSTVIGSNLLVPPNNQGIATPFYNQGDNGNNPSKDGVDRGQALDKYTAQTVYDISDGHRVFAGQRDDNFYADINAIFDLLKLRPLTKAGDSFDSQGGFNLDLMAINIPVSTIGGDMQIVGVNATTWRQRTRVLTKGAATADTFKGNYVQVGRQGNPLLCEGLIAVEDKDRYNRTDATQDSALFRKYAESPELVTLINAIVLQPLGIPTMANTGRTDLSGIFIPDVIKVDLSTGPARLAGGGPDHPTNPDDPGYSRLGIFGIVPNLNEPLDVLQSRIPGAGFLGSGVQPGGWPNGRRFGDDVVDIALLAFACDLRDPVNPQIPRAGFPVEVLPALTDGINKNDAVYSKVLPYAATPHNGRVYRHNPQQAALTN
jgi:hypothetical protein